MMKEPTYFEQLVQQSLEQTGASFENWWNSEGSEMTFESTDDLRRIAETAWKNGSFLQSMSLTLSFAKYNERSLSFKESKKDPACCTHARVRTIDTNPPSKIIDCHFSGISARCQGICFVFSPNSTMENT